MQTLATLLRSHLRAIPFENLDVLLGRPVALGVGAVQHKLVDARRGGYCFEHATLFGAVLDALGFETARHAARVVLYTPRDKSPRTHMLLTVRVDGVRHVVDPGFGGLAPAVPVSLDAPHDGTAAHWMVRDGDDWVLRTTAGERHVDCWRSPLVADPDVDFVVGNHYTSTHPDSPFRNRLMLRIATDAGSVSVMNREVTVARGASTSSMLLADRAALSAMLSADFGIDLPEVASLRVPAVEAWR